MRNKIKVHLLVVYTFHVTLSLQSVKYTVRLYVSKPHSWSTFLLGKQISREIVINSLPPAKQEEKLPFSQESAIGSLPSHFSPATKFPLYFSPRFILLYTQNVVREFQSHYTRDSATLTF